MLRTIGSIAARSAKAFIDDDALAFAAALSYYALLSMAPLLLIVVAVAGLFFSNDVVQTQLVAQIGSLIGREGASVAQTLLDNAGVDGRTAASLLIGALLMVVGATTVFAQLQQALNRIWSVEAKPANVVVGFLRHRLLSFALVLSIGFLLMVSLVVSALLAALQEFLDQWAQTVFFWRTLNSAVSFGAATLLIAVIFKYLPDAVIAWRDVWLGALLTSALFVGGKLVIGLYLGQASIGSWYGAAGSAVVFMVWIYYASLIFLFGAEITQAVASHRGARIVPNEYGTGALSAPRLRNRA